MASDSEIAEVTSFGAAFQILAASMLKLDSAICSLVMSLKIRFSIGLRECPDCVRLLFYGSRIIG